MAVVTIDMSPETQLRERKRLREKALYDEFFYIEGARAEGREEGRKEGREEGIKRGIEEGRKEGRAKILAEVMQDLKRYGMSDEEIEKILGEK